MVHPVLSGPVQPFNDPNERGLGYTMNDHLVRSNGRAAYRQVRIARDLLSWHMI